LPYELAKVEAAEISGRRDQRAADGRAFLEGAIAVDFTRAETDET
jgi:hypothetical protein